MDQAEFEDLDKLWKTTEPAPPGGSSFDPVPDGTEVAVIVTDQKFDRVGEKQTAVVKVTFEVAEPEQYRGKKVWHDFWLTSNNLKYLMRDLTLLGWRGLPSQLMKSDDSSLIALAVRVVLGVEEYTARDGVTKKLKNTVAFFKAKVDQEDTFA